MFYCFLELIEFKFPQLPRHFQKCLGISGNAGFPQLPATYIFLPLNLLQSNVCRESCTIVVKCMSEAENLYDKNLYKIII